MPHTRSSSKPPAGPPEGRRALVLCGGGITGLTYEVGALRALDDLLVGVTVNDFDIYVGTSAGSLVSALLANGVSATEMALAIEGTHDTLEPPTRWTIYRPNIGELGNRLLRLPRVVQQMVWEMAAHPSRINPLDMIGMLSPLLPSGLFTSDELVRYLDRLFANEGFTNDFRRLNPELHIVSCALDTGERVLFSPYSNSDVPISHAAAASAAVPMLFKPVRIKGVDYVDGGIKGISAIDVAVARGASLIVVINPIVPVDARNVTPPENLTAHLGNHLADMGMRGVYNQVFRGMLHDGMLDHIRLVRQNHPDVDILLIEPRPDDDKMFFHELMSFGARLMVMQHGYESVSNGLYDTWGYLRRILPRHGVHISRRNLERKQVDVPADAVATPNLLRRLLRQTVFDRRPQFAVLDDQNEAV